MSMTIRGRLVGVGEPVFVIAELGLNHGGDVRRALRLVDAAADAGAPAVKIQSFCADRLVAPGGMAPAHVRTGSLRSFFRGFELDAEAHRSIADRAHRRGMALVATPFDEGAVSLLEDIGCDAYKIASGDLTHHTLIHRAAATGKPIVLSTGMSDLPEIRAAVDQVGAAGGRHVAVLHCVSAYPVPPGQENVGAVATLRRALDLTVGLSDHSTQPLSVALAVALGASIYERHLALDTDDDQLERAVSSTPSQLRELIFTAALAQQVLGDGVKACGAAERANRIPSRRSLHAARDLARGEVLDPTAMIALRPGTGIAPRHGPDLIGRRLVRSVGCGRPLHETDLAPRATGAWSDVA